MKISNEEATIIYDLFSDVHDTFGLGPHQYDIMCRLNQEDDYELHKSTKLSCKGCINLNKVYYFIGPVAVRECDCEVGVQICDPFGEPYPVNELCMFKT